MIPVEPGFFIRLPPESLFTSRRNLYSHHPGTIIHMPRNPQALSAALICTAAAPEMPALAMST
jgi:hypothetical protein